MVAVERVRAAHADAWEAEGRARVASGGGAARVRGARLMASGLPFPKWNNADVTGADLDVAAVRRWYAQRAVPWGLRVPVELAVDLGRPLFVKRCFGLRRPEFRPAMPPPGLLPRRAGGTDSGGWFAAAEAAAFGDPVEVAAAWVGPVFGCRGFEHWVAQRDGEVAAVATAVWSEGDAGPAVMLTGLGGLEGAAAVLPALAGAVLAHAFEAQPQVLAHCHAEPGEDVSWLATLGFSEVPGLLVRVVREEAGAPG
jgi:hypothetical protein